MDDRFPSRPLRHIEAVLLDAGGVLMLPSHGPIVAALELVGLGIDPLLLDAAHYAGMRGIDAASRGPFDWIHYLERYVRALAIDVPARPAAIEALRAAFDDSALLWRRPIPGVGDALRALAARGLRLGVVSNAEGTAEARLAELAICQVGAGAGVAVEVVIDSHVVGVEKPDPAIFGHALRAMELDPARSVYVGDSVTIDVAGARAAGLSPVLVDPVGDADTDAPKLRRLAELNGLLSEGSLPR